MVHGWCVVFAHLWDCDKTIIFAVTRLPSFMCLETASRGGLQQLGALSSVTQFRQACWVSPPVHHKLARSRQCNIRNLVHPRSNVVPSFILPRHADGLHLPHWMAQAGSVDHWVRSQLVQLLCYDCSPQTAATRHNKHNLVQQINRYRRIIAMTPDC